MNNAIKYSELRLKKSCQNNKNEQNKHVTRKIENEKGHHRLPTKVYKSFGLKDDCPSFYEQNNGQWSVFFCLNIVS